VANNFDASVAEVLKDEGGYVNHPADPGGITNLGVTKKSYESYVGRPVSVKVMKSLTVDMVKPIYRRKYWDACKCDELPLGVDYAVFDFAVNSGPGRAAKMLQRVLGLTEDGIIGPMTLKAANEIGSVWLINKLCTVRQNYLEDLPAFAIFGKGWTSRVSRVLKTATDMVSD
jgi:lysozyme family protein